jgi:hypothetical protein
LQIILGLLDPVTGVADINGIRSPLTSASGVHGAGTLPTYATHKKPDARVAVVSPATGGVAVV